MSRPIYFQYSIAQHKSHFRRENTVLRGQLFEKTEEDPSKLSVSPNVYVIPNALVPDQFMPSPGSASSDMSNRPRV